MSPLLKGIVVGFSIAAPLGPIGVLCIRRSLVEGSLMGLLTGLGAGLPMLPMASSPPLVLRPYLFF